MENISGSLSQVYFKDASVSLEPIIIFGKSFGLKLLSVYEFLKCDIACKNLVDKLSERGFDKNLCQELGERASIVAMALYDKNNQRVFQDALSVLMLFTPEQLKMVYSQYEILVKKTVITQEIYENKVNKIKKCLMENTIN